MFRNASMQKNFVEVVAFHEKYRNKRIGKKNTFYNAAFFTRSKGKNDCCRKHVCSSNLRTVKSIFEDDSPFEGLVRVFDNSQADSRVCSANAEIARCFFFFRKAVLFSFDFKTRQNRLLSL